jgi:hypothetical protein
MDDNPLNYDDSYHNATLGSALLINFLGILTISLFIYHL